jgi:hypothetical protein
MDDILLFSMAYNIFSDTTTNQLTFQIISWTGLTSIPFAYTNALRERNRCFAGYESAKAKMIRNTQGPIPDDHFENEPSGPAKNVSPLSQALLDHIAALKKMTKPENR